MADINFSELKLENNIDTITIYKNGIAIEIKQYLSILEKAEVIEKIINQALDDNNYANPTRVHVFYVLEMVYAYTNLHFTDEEINNFPQIYDLLISSGLWTEIHSNIPEDEYQFILDSVWTTIEQYYKYRDSILGILETINRDYENLNLDAENIKEKLSNKENVEFLSGVMEKMG